MKGGTTYYFRIRTATGDNNLSPASNVVSITTLPDTPNGLNVASFGPNLLHLEWAKTEDPNPNIVYEVLRFDPASSQYVQISSDLNKTQNNYNGMDVSRSGTYYWDDTTVNPNTNYSYEVIAAIKNAAISYASCPQTSPVNATTYPPAPSNLTLVDVGSGIQLSWNGDAGYAVEIEYTTASLSTVGSDPSHGFVVFAEVSWGSLTFTNGKGEYLFSGNATHPYIPGGSYTFRVVQLDGVARSEYSNTASLVAPIAPKHVRAIGIAPTAVQLFWDFEQNAITNIDDQLAEGFHLLNEQHFLVAWYTPTGTLLGSQIAPADTSSWTVQGLQANTAYVFRVWAYNFDDSMSTTGTVDSNGWPAPTGEFQGRYSSFMQVAFTTPYSNSLDSYKIGDIYNFLNHAADSHYVGGVTINSGYSGWLQYDSPGAALDTGVDGTSLVNESDLLGRISAFTFSGGAYLGANIGLDFYNLFPTVVSEFNSNGILTGDQIAWNYISLYEDTMTMVPYNDTTSSGVNNLVLRVSVEDRPTVSVSPDVYFVQYGTDWYAQFTLNRSNSAGALRVTYGLNGSIVQNSEFYDPSYTAVFGPGSASTSVLIRLKAGFDPNGTIGLTFASNDETSMSTGEPFVPGIPTSQGANLTVVTDAANGTLKIIDGNHTSAISLQGLNSVTILNQIAQRSIDLDQSDAGLTLHLTISAGIVNFDPSNVSVPGLSIQLSNGANLTFQGGNETFASLALDSGTFAKLGSGNLYISGLTISGGTLDLAGHKMVIEATTANKPSTLTALRGFVHPTGSSPNIVDSSMSRPDGYCRGGQWCIKSDEFRRVPHVSH